MESINAVTVKIESIAEYAAAYDAMAPVDGVIVYEGDSDYQVWEIYQGEITYRKWTRRDT